MSQNLSIQSKIEPRSTQNMTGKGGGAAGRGGGVRKEEEGIKERVW